MKSRNSTILIFLVLIILLALSVAAYWFFFLNGHAGPAPAETGASPTSGGFTPLNGGSGALGTPPAGNPPPTEPGPAAGGPGQPPAALPVLRLLSASPIGGYGASTTASTTIIRWIDRGRGNVYEAEGDSAGITTLSNTILPRIYESVWNRNLTAFAASMLPAESNVPTALFAELRAQNASTTAGVSSSTPATGVLTLTPFELKGKNLPGNVIAYAASPAGDKIFTLINENGTGAGYVANFDGSAVTRIFTTPLTEVSIEWPETNTIAITTAGAAGQDGFLYFVNPKTGVWNRILGPIKGLATRTSRDARFIIASAAVTNQAIQTTIFASGSSTTTDAAIRTVADKCAWGNFYKDIVYCAVPTDVPDGTYPDDWYRGTVSFNDKLWQVDAATGEVKLIANIADRSGRPMDAIDLGLDAKDSFLFFMNKKDNSLWSLDLVRTP
ncbi:MAG: hypothetical protein QOG91_564 [Candidatus Parcubacteria bacterium]|jgi:hypothetical protein|nr:hypothetical protein [Candidatus Parcubacteria bacterium]